MEILQIAVLLLSAMGTFTAYLCFTFWFKLQDREKKLDVCREYGYVIGDIVRNPAYMSENGDTIMEHVLKNTANRARFNVLRQAYDRALVSSVTDNDYNWLVDCCDSANERHKLIAERMLAQVAKAEQLAKKKGAKQS